MSEVRILSPRPAPAPPRGLSGANALNGGRSRNAAGTHLSTVEIGDAIGPGAAQMAARIRAGDTPRSRSADGLVERARHAERGAAAVRQLRGGGRLRRQARARLH